MMDGHLRVSRYRSWPLLGVVPLLAFVLPSCGGGTPAASNPTPAPTPTAADVCLALGKGTYDASCSASAPQLGAQVDAAIDKLVQDEPAVFDLSQHGPDGNGTYLVIDKKSYFRGVVANLKAAGVCAEADIFNDHRIKVKTSQQFSDDFNIIDLAGFLRRSPDSYDRSCTPSAFPLDPNPDVPPPDQGCGQPYPPPISHFGVRVFLMSPQYWTLDSTPQIDDVNYCAALGYTDGRSRCPLRPEGNPERVPCEGWRVGIAKDTGRLGPTWQRDGHYCTGPASGCDDDPLNQFQLRVYQGHPPHTPHTYTACADDGACGDTLADF